MWRACARAAADDTPETLVDEQVRRWSGTWSTLRAWFAGTEGQARRLRRQLRDLVAPWARSMQLLMESGGAVTRRAELLRLATAIERAPDECGAWRLWDTATGRFAARNLLLPADGADDPAVVVGRPTVPVTPRFREAGGEGCGRPPPGPRDFSAGRPVAPRRNPALDMNEVSGPELDLVLEFHGRAVTRG